MVYCLLPFHIHVFFCIAPVVGFCLLVELTYRLHVCSHEFRCFFALPFAFTAAAAVASTAAIRAINGLKPGMLWLVWWRRFSLFLLVFRKYSCMQRGLFMLRFHVFSLAVPRYELESTNTFASLRLGWFAGSVVDGWWMV